MTRPTVSQENAGARRLLIAAGTRSYRELGELPQAHEDVRRVATLFEGMGYERILTEVSRDPDAAEFEDAVADWCAGADLTPDDVLVVYYAGHGDRPDAGGYRLAGSDSTARRPRSWISPENLTATLAASPLRNVLIIIDACHAGKGAARIGAVADAHVAVRPRGDAAGSGTWVMVSARHRDLARDGVFPVELERAYALGDGPSQRYLAPAKLADRITRAFEQAGRRQHCSCSVTDQTVQAPFFPNPRHDPRAEVRSAEEHGGEAGDLTSHFSPRGRGVEQVHDSGSYFTGRKRALDALRARLAGPGGTGPLVVTAAPGSGKSAVLGRLVLDAASDDADHRIDVSINARHQTIDDLVTRLAAAADLTAAGPTELLTGLADRENPFRVVIDSLDEAGPAGDKAEARRIAWDLLRHLATVPCVRLVVGVRRELLLHLGDRVPVIDLDSADYSEDTNTAEYVERILTDAGSPYQADPAAARVVAEGVAQRAGRCFLVARMTATALCRGKPVDVTVPGWARQLPSDTASAFQAYLERMPRDARTSALPLLTTLAFGEGHGVPRTAVWTRVASRLSGITLTESDVDALLEEDGSYVTAVEVEGRKYFRLYHQELADHLKTRALRYRDLSSVQECFVGTLLDSVPSGAGGRDWGRADAYTRDHLATHAAAAGVIDDLIEDPSFVLAAAAAGLVPAVQHAKRNPLLAMVVERCADLLAGRHGPHPDPAAELAFVARTHGATDFARRAVGVSVGVDRMWTEPRRVTPHRIVGRHGKGTYSTTSVWYGWTIQDLVTEQGRHLVVAVSFQSTEVHVWPLDDPSQAMVLPHARPVEGLRVLSHNGRSLAVTLDDGSELRVWDLSDLSLVSRHEMPGCTGFGDVGVLSDGTAIAVARGPGKVVVLDLVSGERLLEVTCARSEGAEWESIPSALLARCGGPDKWLVVCDRVGGTLSLHALEKQVGGGVLLEGLTSPRLSAQAQEPDGTSVVAFFERGTGSTAHWVRLTLLNVASQETASVSRDDDWRPTGRFTTDADLGAVYVAAGQRTLVTLATGAEPCVTHLDFSVGNFTVAPLAREGRPYAVVAGLSSEARVLDCAAGRLVGIPLQGHESAVCAIRVLGTSTSDDLYILTVGNDGTARLWCWNRAATPAAEKSAHSSDAGQDGMAHTQLLLRWPGSATRVIASSWRGIRTLDSHLLEMSDDDGASAQATHVAEMPPWTDQHCLEDARAEALHVLLRDGERGGDKATGTISVATLLGNGKIEKYGHPALRQVPASTVAHLLPAPSGSPYPGVISYDPSSGSVILVTDPARPGDTSAAPWQAEQDDTVVTAGYVSTEGQSVLMAALRRAGRGDTRVDGSYVGHDTPVGPACDASRTYLWAPASRRLLSDEPLLLPPEVDQLVPHHSPRGTSYVALTTRTGLAAVLNVDTGQRYTVHLEQPDEHRTLSLRLRELTSGRGYFVRWADTPEGEPLLLYMDPAGMDDNVLASVTLWNSTSPHTPQRLPVQASRILWTGQAPNGETLVAVSDRHGVTLCHLPSCEPVWSAPIPALVTSLVVLPGFDIAVSTQQGVVLLRPRLSPAWQRLTRAVQG
ncbi:MULTISPECIES: caspase family protein [Streptomyces]|uniref:caspase family protein n=1 Tax=Streptomyces TaxID=1883 RepID=UPI00099D6833|nr:MULTISPECIES: caspase family protein [Streptomyces]